MTPLAFFALWVGVSLWVGFIWFVLAPLVRFALATLCAVIGAVVHRETRRAKRNRQVPPVVTLPVINRQAPPVIVHVAPGPKGVTQIDIERIEHAMSRAGSITAIGRVPRKAA